jgi:hypothetical protein
MQTKRAALGRRFAPSRNKAIGATALALFAATASTAAAEHAGPAAGKQLHRVNVALRGDVVDTSTNVALHGRTVFVVHNKGSEKRSFVIARHRGVLPHFFFNDYFFNDFFVNQAIPFVPVSEVSARVVLPGGSERRLTLDLPAGRYVLVNSRSTSGVPIVANAVHALREG